MTRNMAHAVADVGGRQVFLALHTKVPPSSEEWQSWTDRLEKHSQSARWDLADAPNLVVTDGGAPSTAQRTAINILISQAKTMPAVALVTDSTVVRTIIRAFSIFNPRIRVFSPSELQEAAAFMGVSRADVPRLIAACVDLEGEVLGAGALETIRVMRQVGGR